MACNLVAYKALGLFGNYNFVDRLALYWLVGNRVKGKFQLYPHLRNRAVLYPDFGIKPRYVAIPGAVRYQDYSYKTLLVF